MKLQLLKVAAFALLQALTVHSHEDPSVAVNAIKDVAADNAAYEAVDAGEDRYYNDRRDFARDNCRNGNCRSYARGYVNGRTNGRYGRSSRRRRSNVRSYARGYSTGRNRNFSSTSRSYYGNARRRSRTRSNVRSYRNGYRNGGTNDRARSCNSRSTCNRDFRHRNQNRYRDCRFSGRSARSCAEELLAVAKADDYDAHFYYDSADDLADDFESDYADDKKNTNPTFETDSEEDPPNKPWKKKQGRKPDQANDSGFKPDEASKPDRADDSQTYNPKKKKKRQTNNNNNGGRGRTPDINPNTDTTKASSDEQKEE